MLLKIQTQNDKVFWIQEINDWYTRHKLYINEKTINEEKGRYWNAHKLIRRFYSSIKSALPNMFHYLKDANIPRTTNGIEGFFSHLKNHLDIPRGLTTKNRMNFIKWYIFNQSEMSFL